MDVPYVVLSDCERVVRACSEALHTADELEAEGKARQAATYRKRALRHADWAARSLQAMCGIPGASASLGEQAYRIAGRAGGEATGSPNTAETNSFDETDETQDEIDREEIELRQDIELEEHT